MLFSVQKYGGKLRLGLQRKMYDNYVDTLSDGWYDLSIKKKKHLKTSPQLNYWWGVVVPTARGALDEATGGDLFTAEVDGYKVHLEITNDIAHDFMKKLWAVHKQRQHVSVAKLSDEEMSELITFAVDWLAEHLGVCVPPPER